MCIVSDDCSSENLRTIYDEIIGEDPRFTFRRNSKNMGSKSLVSHWNLLVDLCETEYLIMASDDDVYEIFFLEEIDKLTQKYPEINIFRGRTRSILEDGREEGHDIDMPEYQTLMQHLNTKYSYMTYILCIPNFVFKQKKLKEKGYFEDFPMACFSDDSAMMKCADNGICNTQQIVFSFRTSAYNLSNRINEEIAKKRIRASELFSEWALSFYEVQVRKSQNTDYIATKEGIKRHVWTHIMSHIGHISIKDAFDLCSWLSKNSYFPRKFSILKYYIYYIKSKCV